MTGVYAYDETATCCGPLYSCKICDSTSVLGELGMDCR